MTAVTHADHLFIIKLTGCLNCDLDSYKASLGCCTCAKRAINAFKGSDKMLLRRFEEAKVELAEYLKEHQNGQGEAAGENVVDVACSD